MIIGHLPAGYIAARGTSALGASRAIFFGVLIGSIAPDIDMLWFHFMDHGSQHHHNYLPHRPIVWVAILCVGLLMRQQIVLGAGLGGLLHMALDTIAGSIAWAWPLYADPFTLVVVPATHDHWVASFMAHWTFRVEIATCAVALALYWKANLSQEPK